VPRATTTPRTIPLAAQNAFRGLLRVVTPVVNLVNRFVQGITGGRGDFAQLARNFTGLVNRTYQNVTGQTWGAQGGTSSAAMSEGTGEEDTPLLPPPPPDIGVSNDRLLELNEEEEETRPFNWNEFFGDDFSLEDIGDSVRESAENFLRFVHGEVDTDAPLLTQIRTLFERVGVTMTAMFTVDPVNENLSMAGVEWINDYLAAPQVLNDMGVAEYAITQIVANADHFDVELGDIEGMTTEEVVNRYLQLLHDREAYATEWGVSLLGLSDEIAQIELFQRTFGESDAVTLDMVRWVGDNIRNFDFDSPNAVDNVIRTYLTTQIVQGQYTQVGELDLESASLHDLALYYQKNLDQPVLTTSEGLDHINLERGRVAELLDAMNREYDRSVYPDASLLLMVGQILWEPADWAITGIEIKRQLEERDYLGAGVNGVLLALPFVSGWMDDLFYHAPDDLTRGGNPLDFGDAENLPGALGNSNVGGLLPTSSVFTVGTRTVTSGNTPIELTVRSYGAEFSENVAKLSGMNYTEENILAIAQNPQLAEAIPGRSVVWLESGNLGTGFVHVGTARNAPTSHIEQMETEFNLDGEQAVVDFVMQTIANETPSAVSSRPGNVPGRVEYALIYEIEGQTLNVAIGDNGYIISFYPGDI
jgi:hypothetical protein